MIQVGDSDSWFTIAPEHLWVTDKLILAKRLGYVCGPAGVLVPAPNDYIVRPCVNYRMMSLGAEIKHLTPDEDSIPAGYFWCEVFTGRHLSFDYNFGKQVLAVEGFRDSDRLDRFCKWTKVKDVFHLPPVIQDIADANEWLNVEVVGDKIIEVHFRFNDDFANHDSDSIVPIWKENFYHSACGDRIGFLIS